MKLTPKQRSALQWLADNGPIGAIPVALGLRVMQRLVDMGLARRLTSTTPMGFVRYDITAPGRDALAA